MHSTRSQRRRRYRARAKAYRNSLKTMKLEIHYPLKPSILTQPFGGNLGANYQQLLGLKGHPGEDWANIVNGVNQSFGLPVRAAHNGTVIACEQDTMGSYTTDWTVVLVTDQPYDYPDGQSNLTYFKSVYAHCQPNSFKVKVGDKVKIGDILALCGASGITPPPDDPIHSHVHFGLKPAHFIDSVGVDEPGYWANTYQENGYGGAIDNSSYWSGKYAEDFAIAEAAIPVAENIVTEISTAPISNAEKSSLLDSLAKVVKAIAAFFGFYE